MLAEDTFVEVGLEKELTLCWYEGIGVEIPRPFQNPLCHKKLPKVNTPDERYPSKKGRVLGTFKNDVSSH